MARRITRRTRTSATRTPTRRKATRRSGATASVQGFLKGLAKSLRANVKGIAAGLFLAAFAVAAVRRNPQSPGKTPILVWAIGLLGPFGLSRILKRQFAGADALVATQVALALIVVWDQLSPRLNTVPGIKQLVAAGQKLGETVQQNSLVKTSQVPATPGVSGPAPATRTAVVGQRLGISGPGVNPSIATTPRRRLIQPSSTIAG